MLKKLYHMVGLLGITTMLSLLGLVGFLLVGDRLTEENAAVLGRMLRGEPLIPATQPATTQPADIVERSLGGIDAAAAAEQANREVENLVHQQAMMEMQQYKDMIASRETEIIQQRRELAEARKKWAEEIKAAQGKRESKAFKAQIKLFESLPAKRLKAILEGMDEAEAAECLTAMKAQSRADVIGRFKTAADQKLLQRLLVLMRKVD